MTEKHLSSQFDSELNGVSSRVMELGGMVESQIHQAVYALSEFDAEAADRVVETEVRVNAMEMEIDRELSSIIARRQPTARDLRLLIAIFLPFLAFFTIGRPIAGIICLILQVTLIGWLPATIWAVYALSQYKTDQKIEQALRRRQP